MIALDSLNSGGGSGVNLAPIYQELNFLNDNLATVKNDVSALNIDLGTIKNDISNLNIDVDSIKTQITNLNDEVNDLNAHDVFLFGPDDSWTTLSTYSGFLPDIYNIITQGGGGELNTELNYNFNANYDAVELADIEAKAISYNNIYKNRIELIGNLNFAELFALNNTKINTCILKNKNFDNSFGGLFVNSKNKLLNIDGFKRITNLIIADTPGDIKIENCEEILFILQCDRLKDVKFENIGVINAGGSVARFNEIDNLNLKNVSVHINNDLYFENVKKLVMENATIDGQNTKTFMFHDVQFGDFNNVEFNFSLMTVKAKPIFKNNINYYNKNFNNFNFKNCYFNLPHERMYFEGMNGTFDNCRFGNINFGALNDVVFNMGITGEWQESQQPYRFNVQNSFNNININHSGWYDFMLSITSQKNTINFKNYNNDNVPYNILIDEGNGGHELFNEYKFENDKPLLTMNIIYGNAAGNNVFYKNPKINLGKNNILTFNNGLSYNTFDIYFNDIFKSQNFKVDVFREKVESFSTFDSSFNINSFNLHFNKNNYETTTEIGTITAKTEMPIYIHIFTTTTDRSYGPQSTHTVYTEYYQMDLHFYHLFAELLGGTNATNNEFLSKVFNTCLRLYNGDGHQLTYKN